MLIKFGQIIQGTITFQNYLVIHIIVLSFQVQILRQALSQKTQNGTPISQYVMLINGSLVQYSIEFI